MAKIERDYILNIIQSNGADEKYKKQRRRIQMAEVCPKCGREFMNSRTGKCPICEVTLVEKISYSEEIRRKQLEQEQEYPTTQKQQLNIQPKIKKEDQKSGHNISDSENNRSKTQMKNIEIREDSAVKVIGIILVVLGILGIFMGMMMFGDIGIACLVGAVTALLSGIALIQVANAIKKLKQKQ